MAFQDHFSKQAREYKKYRPTYPEPLFEYLASASPSRALAWDCATGNGQAALGLTPYFDSIVATDASEAQLAKATPHPKITYRVARAEASGLEARSVDLLTVATAVHWFDFDRFYTEARRVLRPEGLIAVWAYNEGHGENPEVDKVFDGFTKGMLRDYFPKEIRWITENYRTLPFPFKEIAAPKFELRVDWDLEGLLGYVSSWSAVQLYVERNGADPLVELRRDLERAWPKARTKLARAWDLHLRVGHP